jgi:hypothetical protein
MHELKKNRKGESVTVKWNHNLVKPDDDVKEQFERSVSSYLHNKLGEIKYEQTDDRSHMFLRWLGVPLNIDNGCPMTVVESYYGSGLIGELKVRYFGAWSQWTDKMIEQTLPLMKPKRVTMCLDTDASFVTKFAKQFREHAEELNIDGHLGFDPKVFNAVARLKRIEYLSINFSTLPENAVDFKLLANLRVNELKVNIREAKQMGSRRYEQWLTGYQAVDQITFEIRQAPCDLKTAMKVLVDQFVPGLSKTKRVRVNAEFNYDFSFEDLTEWEETLSRNGSELVEFTHEFIEIKVIKKS